MNKYQQIGEIWEIKTLLYFMLGIMVDKMENNHGLAIFLWIWGIITYTGVLVQGYRSNKLQEKENHDK